MPSPTATELETRRLRYVAWLGELVGQPLTGLWRPIGQDFQFGTDPKNAEDAAFTLRLLQDWRVARGGLVVLGSSDHGRSGARRFYDRVTPPRDSRARERWTRVRAFFRDIDAEALIVGEVPVSTAFEPRLAFTDGTTIEASHTSTDPFYDLWWFGTPTRSILVTPRGDGYSSVDRSDRSPTN